MKQPLTATTAARGMILAWALLVLLPGASRAQGTNPVGVAGPNALDCDFNADGACGQPDYSILLACRGSTTPHVDPACEATDMDGDGSIGPADLDLYASATGILTDASAFGSFARRGAALSGAQGVVAATTINLTLEADLASHPGWVIYTVGLEDASSGLPLSINGYTLDFVFDASELTLLDVEQLVSFGALGQLDFASRADCLNGRCTAGNAPDFDSPPVGPLFSVTFALSVPAGGAQDDFVAGILDPVFDDVTQPTGSPVFDHGIVEVSHAISPASCRNACLDSGLICVDEGLDGAFGCGDVCGVARNEGFASCEQFTGAERRSCRTVVRSDLFLCYGGCTDGFETDYDVCGSDFLACRQACQDPPATTTTSLATTTTSVTTTTPMVTTTTLALGECERTCFDASVVCLDDGLDIALGCGDACTAARDQGFADCDQFTGTERRQCRTGVRADLVLCFSPCTDDFEVAHGVCDAEFASCRDACPGGTGSP